MKKLTNRQSEILEFIKSFFVENQRMPTFKEIGDCFGFTLNAAHDHVVALRRKGFLELKEDRGAYRSIKLKGFEVKLVAIPVTE